MSDRSQVLKNYGDLVSRTWDDESVIGELQANPHKILNESGFDIPRDAIVNLIFADLSQVGGAQDTQVDAYNTGRATGVYDFIIPSRPSYDGSDIPLHEDILDLMAGGALGGGEPCTCCCPCCCGVETETA